MKHNTATRRNATKSTKRHDTFRRPIGRRCPYCGHEIGTGLCPYCIQ